ncbi:MAG: hypothetical protein IPH77_03730 [Ignavibacteria bacterium]|nr:hypothetical protein [Ignavibacteria bacterium]
MNRLLIYFSLMMALVFSSCQNKAQNMDGQAQVSEFKLKPNLEIIQFHSEHRCQTCMDIEAMTKEAILPYRGIPFRLINVDDSNNKTISYEFRTAGTSLFIYDPVQGKKLDLTDFAFMNASDKEKFIKGLQKEIDNF